MDKTFSIAFCDSSNPTHLLYGKYAGRQTYSHGTVLRVPLGDDATLHVYAFILKHQSRVRAGQILMMVLGHERTKK
jgi:hypothetical protein